ncbi:MAG TPA: hypothetical protein VN620_05730 [Candidatus Methylomirabilis sp.]|nr:hypothetical protein [Candidatus Methylomirabilis sp.]
MNIAEIKAYQDKINAQLQEAKALLNGFEAHAKGKMAQSEIDAINRLKAKHQEIEKKVHHDLKTAGEVAIAAKVKADIDAEMARFKTSVDQLAAKFKSQPVAH